MSEELEKTSVKEAAVAEGSFPQTRAVLRVIVVFLSVALSLWILYLIAPVIFLLILSVFFAYLIAPLVGIVQRLLKLGNGMRGRMLGTAIIYLVVIGLIALGISFLLPIVGDQITELLKQAPAYISKIQGSSHILNDFYSRYRVPPTVRRSIDTVTAHSIDAASRYAKEGAFKAAGWLAYLPWLVLIPILAFFFLKDAEVIQRSLLRLLPRGSMRWRGRELFQEINRTLASYIRAQLIASLFIGIVCSIGFELLRLPYALVLGIIAGILEFIPLAGPVTVMVLATILAALHSFSQAILVLLFLLVLRVVEDYMIFPRIMGHGIHIHPLATILTILCGAEIGGIVGIFLSIPFIAIFTVVYRHWLGYSGSDSIVGSILKPAQSTAAQPTATIPAQAPRKPNVTDPPPSPS